MGRALCQLRAYQPYPHMPPIPLLRGAWFTWYNRVWASGPDLHARAIMCWAADAAKGRLDGVLKELGYVG